MTADDRVREAARNEVAAVIADAILDTSHNGLDCGTRPTPIGKVSTLVADALLEDGVVVLADVAVERVREAVAAERERILSAASEAVTKGSVAYLIALRDRLANPSHDTEPKGDDDRG